MTLPRLRIPQRPSADPVQAQVRTRINPWVLQLSAAGIVLVLGYFVPSVVGSASTMTVLFNGVILGLTALSVGFLLNLLGWVSFGAAAFSGGGAYLFGILAVSKNAPVTESAVGAVVIATAVSLLIGLIFVRSKALVFTMLTLALGQMLVQLVSLNGLRSTTGGADGLVIDYHGDFFGLSSRQLGDPGTFWYLTWTLVMLGVVVVTVINLSRFGRTLRGIRENESRLQHSGFNTYWPKVLAFGFAGLLGATAGVLQAMSIAFVSTDVLSFGTSGTVVVAALIGGYRSPFGPIIGGLLLTWGQDLFGSSGELFLYTGIAVVVVLVLFPDGIAGLANSLWRLGTSRNSTRTASER